MNTRALWRVQLIFLCALVFLFALHAKTAVYNGGATARVTPSTASKLWLSGQKMDIRPVVSGASVLFWMMALCLLGVDLHQEPQHRSAFALPVPTIFALRHLHRFLRPPPIQA